MEEEKERQRKTEEEEKEKKRIAEDKERKRIAEQKRIAEDNERKRIEEERLKEQMERDFKLEEERLKKTIEKQRIDLEKQEKDIENDLNYYRNEMKEIEYKHNNNIAKLQEEVKNYRRELQNGGYTGQDYHYVNFQYQKSIEDENNENEKYESRKKEIIRLYNKTINDKSNLFETRGKLLDISKIIGNNLTEVDKRSDFENAMLYLSSINKQTKKKALKRTAKNRSYQNKKISEKLHDEKEIDMRKRRRNIIKNRIMKRDDEEKQKRNEKLKSDINLLDVRDEIELKDEKSISIIGSKNNNKTLKNNTFRKIKLIT